MFNIFTSNADGSTQFVSVGRLSQAQQIARELSHLVPGEYFGFFERIDGVEIRQQPARVPHPRQAPA